MEEGLGADPMVIALISASNMIIQACLMIPVGRLTDYFGRRIVLLLGILCSELAILGFSFIFIPWMLIFPQMVMGFAWPAMATSTYAMVTDITTRRNRSQGMAWLNAGFAIGGSIGPLLAGLILSQSGNNFNLAFQILSIFPIASILLLLIAFSENRTTHQYFRLRER